MKKAARQFKRIGLIGNAEKPAFRRVIQQAARLITDSGRIARADTDIAALAREVDLLLVFGGDGTMLRAARETAGSATPILGINTGSLGFLTAASAKDLTATLKKVWAGEVRFESRPLIEARGKKSSDLALNDFVIARGSQPRLIELEVRVDGQPVTRYRADGLIVSSPTGSTAYSLAAGGAIIVPTAEVFALTPVCAHTLSNRSLVLGFDSKIEIKNVSSRDDDAVLSGDGQSLHKLAPGETVTIRRSRHTARLVYLQDSSFFGTLRAKLGWRGAAV